MKTMAAVLWEYGTALSETLGHDRTEDSSNCTYVENFHSFIHFVKQYQEDEGEPIVGQFY